MASSSSTEAKRKGDDAEMPSGKRSKPDYGDAISVLVGPDEKRFFIHKESVCKRSPFFSKACSLAWKEGKEQLVKLPPMEVATFETYIHHIYTGEIILSCEEPGHSIKDEEELIVQRTLDLRKLHVAADLLLDTVLKNATIDKFLKIARGGNLTGFCASHVQYVWENTTENSHLRKYVVDRVASLATAENFKSAKVDLPLGFVFDVTVRLIEEREQEPSEHLSDRELRCVYHDHTDGLSCDNEDESEEE